MLEAVAANGRMMNRYLPLESGKPILLPLPREVFLPDIVNDFRAQAVDHGRHRRLKTPPVYLGPQCVHGMARNTAIAFEPYPLAISAKISRRVPMSPYPAVAAGAGRRPRPGVIFTRFN